MQLRGGSRESGFKESYKSIYISIALHPIPGGCDLAVDRKCAFGATTYLKEHEPSSAINNLDDTGGG